MMGCIVSALESVTQCHAEFVTEAPGHNQVRPQPGASRCHNTGAGRGEGAGADTRHIAATTAREMEKPSQERLKIVVIKDVELVNDWNSEHF